MSKFPNIETQVIHSAVQDYDLEGRRAIDTEFSVTIRRKVDESFAVDLLNIHVVVLVAEDGTYYLEWSDNFNWWIEHYEKLSQVFGRIALLQECAETNFEKGFSASAEHFASDWNQFAQRQIS